MERLFKKKYLLSQLCGLASALFILDACRPSPKNEKEESQTIIVEYREALASADSSWQVMIKSDDAKIDNMSRLADELKLIDGADTALLRSTQENIGKLKLLRYSKENMGESGKIDQYDSSCTSAFEMLRKEISRNPKAIQYQLVNQLKNEITVADDSVLFYRKSYDKQADRINHLLSRDKEGILKKEATQFKQNPLPVFRLKP
jgi:hypothetical protein